jgi:hypothetical protein
MSGFGSAVSGIASGARALGSSVARIGSNTAAKVGSKVTTPFRSAPTAPKPYGPLNQADTAKAVTATDRLKYIDDAQAVIKNPASTKAQKMAAQQTLKDMGAKRGARGFAFNPDGSVKIGNMFKVATATGIAGVVAWLTFRGLGGVPGGENLEIVDETDPNAGGLLDMGSPQFAWMSICCMCCLCCVCLVLLVVAASA